MSQRLHIGETDSEAYDCVIDSPKNVKVKLLKEWLQYDGCFYSGPWRIYIGDVDLFKQIQPEIMEVLQGFRKYANSAHPKHRWPECVWTFERDDKKEVLEHPPQWELDEWLLY